MKNMQKPMKKTAGKTLQKPMTSKSTMQKPKKK